MNIAITGASGFIGTPLCHHLREQGNRVIEIGRKMLTPESHPSLQSVINQSDVVINLAGETITKRWNQSNKKKIIESRVETTKKIVECINSSPNTKLLISTSAVGFYPSSGIHDEYSTTAPDNTFLASVCSAWEAEAARLDTSKRLAIMRLGIVLTHDGGLLKKLEDSTMFKVGVIFGSGRQPISWISRQDLIRAIDHIITHPKMKGVYNLTAPQVVIHKDLMSKICHKHNCLFIIRIPSAILDFIMGEQALMLTTGQYIQSTRLKEEGFHFKRPTIDSVLK